MAISQTGSLPDRDGLLSLLAGRRSWFASRAPAEPQPPIRSELFSVERLEQHAESLAAAQAVVRRVKAGRPLAPRLFDNARAISEAYRAIVAAAGAQQAITPAASWLLDNFHVVEEQVRQIKNDLPPRFYRMLPKLAEGPLEGYPRVFGVAWALVAHTDSAFDMEKLTRFVEAYQRVQPLSIGELWALSITMRITLVENLRRLAEAIVERLSASRKADELADRFLAEDAEISQGAVERSLDAVPWSSAFAVQLAQRLRDRDPNRTPALRWLNDRLTKAHTSADQIVREEVARQGAMNVTVRNVITSMRFVSMINWAEFFEEVSPVDKVLRAGSDFAKMDFPTRDLYRRAVEELARASKREETEVAEHALAAAKRAAANQPKARVPARESEPGYYLISRGRRALEEELGCKVPWRTRAFRFNSDLGVGFYVGAIVLVTLVLAAGVAMTSAGMGVSLVGLAALTISSLVPASDVAVAMLNYAITRRIGATLLPGMELKEGVPPELCTLIVVPTLLVDAPEIRKQVEHLEVHYLSNPDANFFYALASDWRDARSEHAPGDEALLEVAAAGIADLNRRYAAQGLGPRFFLLHRRRVWNTGEERWIG
ncbi:MAG: glycosyl transferase, partial [Alphaproteobacteria bacterium]|nr:glycosyl transferase [Alphaproteobacteria bacterium]